ncbi:hypothetical protein C1H46_037366, partial [Malus baccata]
STFICKFFVEAVNLKDSFNISGYTDFYCQDCIVKFVVSKLQDNVTRITCPVPECTGTLDPEYCREILSKDIFDRNWERRVKTRCWKSLPRRRGGGGVQIAITMLKEYLGAATSNAGVDIVSVTKVECKVQVTVLVSTNVG